MLLLPSEIKVKKKKNGDLYLIEISYDLDLFTALTSIFHDLMCLTKLSITLLLLRSTMEPVLLSPNAKFPASLELPNYEESIQKDLLLMAHLSK